VLFYNTENLFDTYDDPSKNDDEFLPEGLRRWTHSRYRRKLANVARVVVATSDAPILVGLCEVESDSVLHDLTRRSPLRALDYRYLLTQSADMRGINTALLYRRSRFRLLGWQAITVPFSEPRRSRDILHACGEILCGDTLDVFVAHFPSRSDGAKNTERARGDAARRLRAAVDSVMAVRQTPLVVVMGDLNDYPTNRSVRRILRAEAPAGVIDDTELYHLLARKAKGDGYGSYKYKGVWGLLDHLIVSGRLLRADARLRTSEADADVMRLPFLLTEDVTYGGYRPFGTYHGMRYQGGFSDHLPVVAVFEETISAQ
jgi:exonuclease III